MDRTRDEADQAIPGGEIDRALARLSEISGRGSPADSTTYARLGAQLVRAGRYEDADRITALGVEAHPAAYQIWNLRGLALRRLGRPAEARTAFEHALRLRPDDDGVRHNLVNLLIDASAPAEAYSICVGLAERRPADAAIQRLLARTLHGQGRLAESLTVLRHAVTLDPNLLGGWLDLARGLLAASQPEAAEAACDEALVANADDVSLIQLKVRAMFALAHRRRIEDFLLGILPRHQGAAWLHSLLSSAIATSDAERSLAHAERAHALDPDDPSIKLQVVDRLEQARRGEGERLDLGFNLARDLMRQRPSLPPAATRVLHQTFLKSCAFADEAALGPPMQLGRDWVEARVSGGFLALVARTKTPEDHRELLELHRAWARGWEEEARRRPIQRPAARRAGDRLRIGFMSSDLRRHPVAYFALPLFEHADRDRFELFAYSFYDGADLSLKAHIEQHVDALRWWPGISTRDAAQKIADDDLDLLIEMGGHTSQSRLDVLAYRPARRQASWLGYPHSAGLSAIDYFICDGYSMPSDPALLLEQPLLMPRTWISLGERFFSTLPDVSPGLPETRHGFLTFGTANNPVKYTPEVLRAWARIVAAVPRSRFLIIRPEAGAACFRSHIEAEFAKEGVTADRLGWRAVRAGYADFYNDIDISLDTFPLTGGTTTTEALWMGVPVVSLVGDAFHERISYSVLSNAGLGDLCASTLDRYHQIALELAADTGRRAILRQTLRDELRAGPLGQTKAFARDFYDTVGRVVLGA